VAGRVWMRTDQVGCQRSVPRSLVVMSPERFRRRMRRHISPRKPATPGQCSDYRVSVRKISGSDWRRREQIEICQSIRMW